MEKVFGNIKSVEVVPYDLDGKVLLFPVRHHSPVCSYQLVKTIQEYKPEIILIEGPENANSLIPILTSDNTKLLVAIYYYYKDSKKLVSENGEDINVIIRFCICRPNIMLSNRQNFWKYPLNL